MSPVSLELKYFTYPDQICSKLFHFKAEGPMGSVGFGTDDEYEIAFVKALTECAERHCLRSLDNLPKTSNGFAGHCLPESAKVKANLELIERDAFLLGWLSGRSPHWIDSNFLCVNLQIEEVFSSIKKSGLNFKIGRVAKTGDIETLVGVLLPGIESEMQFGCVFASSSGHSFLEALAAVAKELARAATVLINRYKKFGEVVPSKVSDPFDGKSTFDHYLKEDFESVRFYLDHSQEPLSLDPFSVEFDLFSRRIISPRLDIFVAHAKSRMAQDLFFGTPGSQDINFKRFEQARLEPTNLSVMPLP